MRSCVGCPVPCACVCGVHALLSAFYLAMQLREHTLHGEGACLTACGHDHWSRPVGLQEVRALHGLCSALVGRLEAMDAGREREE
jgi:hypothetical protein